MRGLVVGRFQPLHNGHAQLVQFALEQCGQAVVAIGSSAAPPSLRNPFSLAERQAMLAAAFPGLPTVAVPDIHDDARWGAHCLRLVGQVDRAYGNGLRSLDLLEREGVQAVSPGLVKREEWSATNIRRLLAEDDPAWRKLVPPRVAELLVEWNAPGRLRRLE